MSCIWVPLVVCLTVWRGPASCSAASIGLMWSLEDMQLADAAVANASMALRAVNRSRHDVQALLARHTQETDRLVADHAELETQATDAFTKVQDILDGIHAELGAGRGFKKIPDSVPLIEDFVASHLVDDDAVVQCRGHCLENSACDGFTLNGSVCKLFTRADLGAVYLRKSTGVNYYTRTCAKTPVNLYTLVEENRTPEAAMARCPVIIPSSHLVDIQTEEESRALWAFQGTEIWTSGRYAEGTWTWASSGEGFSYTAWGRGEPNGHGREDALQMRWPDQFDHNANWNDKSSSVELWYICEVNM